MMLRLPRERFRTSPDSGRSVITKMGVGLIVTGVVIKIPGTSVHGTKLPVADSIGIIRQQALYDQLQPVSWCKIRNLERIVLGGAQRRIIIHDWPMRQSHHASPLW